MAGIKFVVVAIAVITVTSLSSGKRLFWGGGAATQAMKELTTQVVQMTMVVVSV